MAVGTGEQVKLLGAWASPYVARVKLALHLKGVSYEYMEEDLTNKSERLLRSNPVNKKVPVLIHGGKPICESQVIVQYIDEAFASVGPTLLPADPHERAVARFWATSVDDKVLLPWGMLLRAKRDEERAEWTRQTLAAVDVLEEGVRECSKRKVFFGGDDVGYLDVLLGGMVPWVYATKKISGHNFLDTSKAPLLAAWMERFAELDGTKAVFQDVDSLVEYVGTVLYGTTVSN
ncbi:probable glutathione S-transferase GSTU6 [Aegilops tauschii subsp. strangulata]|uniref:Glutathione S-transferase n=2 Tax=Aegilops tauschii TaxID=37682 RepID=A0A453QHU9_AEGTS|nr:probable glutathione S-transferase GSTU6 [Aegilops tauschii subsp. strangulata]